jgi:hypothetical protein
MKLGISFIAVGLFFLPFGVISIIEEYKEYKKLPMNERIKMLMGELTELTGGIGGSATWILGLALLLIIGGCAILLDYYHMI